MNDLSVRMGNNSFVPVLGWGTTVFSLNGKRVLVHNVLHVPGLAVPLYSLWAHLQQRGCGFLGTFDDGFHVYFPSFILSVDMSSDCHLTYKSLGNLASLQSLHYVQTWCAATLYPSKTSASTLAFIPPVAIIEDKDGASDSGVSLPDDPALLAPASPLVPPPLSPSDLGSISGCLDSLSCLVERLLPSAPIEASMSDPPGTADTALPILDVSLADSPPIWLLSTMSQEDVLQLVHHEGRVMPSVRPCDTAKSCDKKTHWTAKELHRTMGCQKFCNYKHLLQVSRDGTWVDGGKFPPALGSFATVTKSNKGKPLDQTRYKYLDVVHVDMAFGDCLSIGGF